MIPFRRISAWHILATIFLIGCTTLVLSLHSPKAQLTVWLDRYSQHVGALIVVLYLLFRLFRPFLPSAIHSAPHAELTSHQDAPFWGEGVPALADLPWGSMEWSRAKAIHEGASLPVPDAVYRIIEFNDWCSEFSILPSELVWLASAAQLDIWSQRARMLRLAAYRVGDAGLSKNGTYDKAREKFIAENPGFSDETYERAISYGYQQAR
jgi:hypothetical protein